ncbi:MAG: DinB family protein [Saprospiraceae bacterium]|nr:DinB family protein [Saprospiraceae bacterium]
MTPKIEKLWQTLEQQRINLFKELETIDSALLNREPAPYAWTALQNLEHLIKAETASLAYLKKKLSHGSEGIAKAGFKSWGRRFLLRLAFALPTLKFKAPKYLGDLPETSDFQDVKLRFAAHRVTLKSFLDTMPNDLLESEVWKHPSAGKMSIAQMLDFFEDHFNRHEKQLKRALKL